MDRVWDSSMHPSLTSQVHFVYLEEINITITGKEPKLLERTKKSQNKHTIGKYTQKKKCTPLKNQL